jgi:predicted MFS family arabinose efflux permease
MHRRLAILMFLQYAVPGAFVPLFTVWLTSLGFSPMAMAWASATSALAALTAPLLAGQVADRWVPAERCIAGCAALTGVLLWILATLNDPLAVFCLSLAAWFFLIPVLTLGVSLSFRQLAHPERDFGRVRLWGTAGWMMPGLVLGYWFSDPPWLIALLEAISGGPVASTRGDGLRLGGVLAFALAVYALTLPHTPPAGLVAPPDAHRRFIVWRRFFDAPLAAFRLCRERSFAVLCLCSLGLYITVPFSSQLTPLLLDEMGLPKWWLPIALTVSQWSEIMTLALLPMLLLRLEVRGTMLLGLLAWAGTMTVQALASPLGVLVPALTLNGVCIACFLVTGQLYVNRRASPDVRASAQGLFTFINGIGLLLGNITVGWVRQQWPSSLAQAFMPAAMLAGVLAVLLAAGFSGSGPRSDKPQHAVRP